MTQMTGSAKKWLVAGAAAGTIAVAGGIGYAAIPGADGVVHACTARNGTLGVIDAEAGETCRTGETPVALLGVGGKAADADTLDGKDSTEFVAAGAKVADSDNLDGLDSTSFLRNFAESVRSEHIAFNTVRSEDIEFGAVRSDELASNAVTTSKFAFDAKAPDAERLDGRNSTDFYAFGSKVADSDTLDNLNSTDFMRVQTYRVVSDSPPFSGEWRAHCGTGDRLISGGYALVDPGTFISGSSPDDTAEAWVVGWVNDGTGDSIRVIALCANQ
jgi:hypothetical protein